MTQPAAPDSVGWQRRWTIDAGSVTLQPVTRRIAQAVLDSGPITRKFEQGSLHDRIPQAMGFARRDILTQQDPGLAPGRRSPRHLRQRRHNMGGSAWQPKVMPWTGRPRAARRPRLLVLCF